MRKALEIPLDGAGLRLTLGVGGYERSATGEVWDDNWLRGFASVEIDRSPAATYRARCDVAWQTTELAAFHASLGALLDAPTGTARLATTEDQVELTIELEGDEGTVSGRLEAHAIAALEFEASTDRTALAATLAALGDVVARYPYRG